MTLFEFLFLKIDFLNGVFTNNLFHLYTPIPKDAEASLEFREEVQIKGGLETANEYLDQVAIPDPNPKAPPEFFGHCIVEGYVLQVDYNYRWFGWYYDTETLIELTTLYFRDEEDFEKFKEEWNPNTMVYPLAGSIHILPDVQEELKDVKIVGGIYDSTLFHDCKEIPQFENPTKPVHTLTRRIQYSTQLSNTLVPRPEHPIWIHYWILHTLGHGYLFTPFYVFSFGYIICSMYGFLPLFVKIISGK